MPAPSPRDAGLCESCRHQRVVTTTRGSRFSMCTRSKTDPRYPKYPRVPVLECPGFEERPAKDPP
ncbi:MAG: hypothetical protein H0V50_01375 [Thermoleophilaceae bacterium]|nr:hypothetical protein [Thermoleophilaceae bacterium]